MVTTEKNNAALVPWLRGLLAITILANLRVGSLFFMPDYRFEWMWQLGSFNAFFLGAIYLAEVAGLLMLLIVNRWAPGRMVLWMLLTFTGVILVITMMNLSQFKLDLWSSWLWIAIYIGEVGLSIYLLWRYRRLTPAVASPVRGFWQVYMLVQGMVLGVYGLGLLLAPAAFSAFWPWKIDSFHGQLYSSMFLMLAVGAFVLSNMAAKIELLAIGLVQLLLGPLAIVGVVLADASQQRTNWSQFGTWAWIGGFAVMALGGSGMVWLALPMFKREKQYRKLSEV